MPCLAPKGNGFLNKPGFRVMLREELGLSVHHLAGISFERFGNPRV